MSIPSIEFIKRFKEFKEQTEAEDENFNSYIETKKIVLKLQ
jgi:hypothetical protein